MQTYQVDVLNPKASKLLKNLADLKLITVRPIPSDNFLKVVERLRTKALANSPSSEDIAKEVDKVRTKRYAKNKA